MGSRETIASLRRLIGACAVCAALAAGQTATVAKETSQERAPMTRTAGEVVVGPEDTVTITALDFEEINKPWRVSSSGELNLPLLGRIPVAGLTVGELETELARRMRKFYKDPHVNAFVSEFRSQPVTVTGAVGQPGVLQLAGPKTLFDVLVLAGGASKPGNGATVSVTRLLTNGAIKHADAHKDETGRYSVVEIPLDEVLEGDTAAAEIRVMAFDTVSVTEGKRTRSVFITGDVAKPGQIDLVTQDSVSLLRALALAGGLNKTAKKRATIMHVRDDGARTAVAEIDLNPILKGKVSDVELIPGDILMVDSSAMGTLFGQAANSAIMSGIFLLGRL